MQLDRRRGSGTGILAVVLWLALLGALAWLVHAALFFFPETWRWTNDGRLRTTWTVRQAIALTLALPLSLWVIASWPSRERAPARAEARAAGREGAPGGAAAAGGQLGCGAFLLLPGAAALLLRPATRLLFPLAGLDPDGGGPLPFLLWLALSAAAIAAGSALAALAARRRA